MRLYVRDAGGETPPTDILQPADLTPLPASKVAPRARTVTTTRSWPVSELIVAMITSVLLHTAWLIVLFGRMSLELCVPTTARL